MRIAQKHRERAINYYEHHIRDYDAATAHLTWDEDIAYSRLLRWYYRKEKPLPADIKEVCRQVRATSKLQRESVENVLREFFILSDDGWHNETCDEVIERFQDGEPEREAKKANEENRLKKHREERSRLFKTLTDAGEHAPWNIKIEDLRRLVKAVSGDGNETPPETKPATPATAPATPATATQTPDTNHQSPVVKDIEDKTHTVGEPEPPNRVLEPQLCPTSEGFVCKALKDAGIPNPNPGHQTLRELIASGADITEFQAAARDAVRKGKPDFAYVIGIVRKRREEAAKMILHQGRMPNRQEAIEQANKAATAGWKPPELRESAA